MRSVCVVAVLLLSSLAYAQEPQELSPEARTQRARVLFEQGRAYYKLGDYQAAIKDFEQAYLFKQLPIFLFNIAQMNRQLGQRQRALTLYEQFVRDAPNDPERAQAEDLIAELRRSLAEHPEPAAPTVALPPPAVEPSPPAAEPSPPAVEPASAAPTGAASPVRVLAVKAAPEAPPRRRTRAWVWGVVVGAAVVVGGAIALGVTLGSKQTDPTPSLGRGHLQ